MADPLSQQELEAAHCWEAEDRVPGRPEMTAFRRQLRYHQSRWRESNGHPIGSQPIVPKPGRAVRPVGSRLPLAYAQESGANFLTAGALDAARARTSMKEPHQSFDHQRLWADLLWSPALAFNLFGDLAANLEPADRPSNVVADAGHRATSFRPAASTPPTSTAFAPRCSVRARPRRGHTGIVAPTPTITMNGRSRSH
jgi:hypothetical protein